MATTVPAMPAVTGDKILQVATQHLGDKYVFGVLVPKDNPNWKGPWDCAEFVSWSVFQATGILYGCENDNGDPASADAFTGYWELMARSNPRSRKSVPLAIIASRMATAAAMPAFSSQVSANHASF